MKRKNITKIILAGVIVIAGIKVLGPTFEKIVMPSKYLNSLETEEVKVDEAYLDNFISKLEVSNEVDNNILRDYILDINNISIDDYSHCGTLKVPVL